MKTTTHSIESLAPLESNIAERARTAKLLETAESDIEALVQSASPGDEQAEEKIGKREVAAKVCRSKIRQLDAARPALERALQSELNGEISGLYNRAEHLEGIALNMLCDTMRPLVDSDEDAVSIARQIAPRTTKFWRWRCLRVEAETLKQRVWPHVEPPAEELIEIAAKVARLQREMR